MFNPPIGEKHDTGKLRWSLLPPGVMENIIRVLEHGANKYSEFNWKEVPNSRTRYYDAAMRHIQAWWEFNLSDHETGESHLAHAICCLMFMLDLDEGEFEQ